MYNTFSPTSDNFSKYALHRCLNLCSVVPGGPRSAAVSSVASNTLTTFSDPCIKCWTWIAGSSRACKSGALSPTTWPGQAGSRSKSRKIVGWNLTMKGCWLKKKMVVRYFYFCSTTFFLFVIEVSNISFVKKNWFIMKHIRPGSHAPMIQDYVNLTKKKIIT